MTFIVDGTNGATFPDTTVQTTALTTGAVTKAMVNTSTANGFGLCRAWVNFNGTGTPAIRDSYNVSSITKGTTGQYTVTFTTAMPNANYAAVVATVGDSSPYNQPLLLGTASQLAGSVGVFNSPDYSLTAADSALMAVVVFSS